MHRHQDRGGRTGKLIRVWRWYRDPERQKVCDYCRGWETGECDGCEKNTAPFLWPPNREALALWLDVFTQMRGAGLGVIGLDYMALDKVAGWSGLDMKKPGLFGKIQLLEMEWTAYLNAKKDKDGFPATEDEDEDEDDA